MGPKDYPSYETALAAWTAADDNAELLAYGWENDDLREAAQHEGMRARETFYDDTGKFDLMIVEDQSKQFHVLRYRYGVVGTMIPSQTSRSGE